MYFEFAILDKISKIAENIYSEIGPMFPVSTYADCIAYELGRTDLDYVRDEIISVNYKDICIDTGYRVSFIIADQVVVEIKNISNSTQFHKYRLLNAMQITGKRSGLLLNFHTDSFSNVIKSYVI